MLVRSTFHRLSSPIVNYSKHTKALFSKSDYASTSIIHVTYRTNLFTTHRLLSSQSKSDIKQENWKQVYYGSLTPQIKAVKVHFSRQLFSYKCYYEYYFFSSFRYHLVLLVLLPNRSCTQKLHH